VSNVSTQSYRQAPQTTKISIYNIHGYHIYRCKHTYIDTRNSPGCPKVDDGGFVVRSDKANGGRLSFHGIQELNRLNGMRVLPRIIHDGQGNAKDGHDRVATFDDG
jgi:hypothetical protein